MALTPTTKIDLGFKAPNFYLPEPLTQKIVSFNDIKRKKGTVVMFICNHCPYVLHIISQVAFVAQAFIDKEIGFVAINVNDVEKYPEDSPEKMVQFAKQFQLPFKYLYDETQQSAKDYFAACTPDFNVFDKNDVCVYRGRFDMATPGNNAPVTGNDLSNALNNLLQNKPIASIQYPSLGCSIKWK